jgi:hypothetical protein
MTRQIGWAAFAALFIAGAVVWGQQAGLESPLAESAIARKEANFVRVNGRPTVLLWARGLQDAGDLDQYAATGLNTAYVIIRGESDEELSAASALASAAEARGLMVVAALAPVALRDSEGLEVAVNARSEAYREAVIRFVNNAARAMQKHPRLIAWSVEAVPPDRVAWGDMGFRAYLEEWYGTLDALNTSWGSSFTDAERITVAGVRDVDAGLPGGIGRASLDFAYYREISYADALSLWARAIRLSDPGRLVLASSLPDYRSIISVRSDFDGLVLNTYPTVAEADWNSQNLHAVDIARRANRFVAIQTLLAESRSSANQVANWANAALLHGAAGVAFSSWPAIRDSEPLRQMVRQTAEAIEATGVFPAEPVARTAILYEPFAGGVMRGGQSLYGYLDGVTPNAPTSLFAAARGGSRFGPVDVLAVSSLADADLHQYGAIIAPMAFYLPQEAQVTIQNFVLRGGVLVADAGIAMYQGDGTVTSMPPIIRDLLGLRHADLGARGQEQDPFAGKPGQPGEVGQPGIAIPVGPGEAGLAINPDVQRFVDFLEEFLGRTDVRTYLGAEFVGEGGPGFRVRDLGNGFSVYAPTFLYETWDAGDPYFNEFHARILSRKRDLEVIGPQGVWPAVSVTPYSDWSIGVASPSGAAAAVDVFGARNQMYYVPAGAMRLANLEEENRVELLFPGAPLAVAEPIPIYLSPLESQVVVTASVVRYGADGVELLVHGAGSQAQVRPQGVELTGGTATPIVIEIRDGPYQLLPGSMHRVVVEEGVRGERRSEQAMMPDRDTGALVIRAPFRWARVIIEPAPEM